MKTTVQFDPAEWDKRLGRALKALAIPTLIGACVFFWATAVKSEEITASITVIEVQEGAVPVVTDDGSVAYRN